LHHLVDGEVRADRVADRADLVRLVGLGAVQGVAVLVREDRHRGDAELVRGAERPDGDLTPVGDQHLAEHGGLLVAAGFVAADCCGIRRSRRNATGRHSIGPVRTPPGWGTKETCATIVTRRGCRRSRRPTPLRSPMGGACGRRPTAGAGWPGGLMTTATTRGAAWCSHWWPCSSR